MPRGVKFLAISGLCGIVLMGLIGLVQSGPAQEMSRDSFLYGPPTTPPGVTNPEPNPEQYKRNPLPPEVVENPADEFSPFSAVLPTALPGSTMPAKSMPVKNLPSTSTYYSADPNLPPVQIPAGQTDLINAQYQPDADTTQSAPITLIDKQHPFPNPSAVIPAPNPQPNKNLTVYTPEQLPVVEESYGDNGTTPAVALTSNPVMNSQTPVSTGPQSTTVVLEWVKRTEINVGQECQCDLLVKNTGETTARNTTVLASFPASVRLLPATTPAPTPAGNQLQWNLGDLAPNQSKAIQVHLIPTLRGDLKTSALVQFSSTAATTFAVQEPLLEVVLKGPKQVQVGDPASQIIQVSNPGTGTARNVEIKTLIPDGLEHPQGKQLTMSVGSLNPGETRLVRLALSAVSGGNHQIKVLAEAKLSKEATPYLRKLTQTEIQIIAPSVKVQLAGPGLRYKNRNATYTISVTNDGTAVSNNVRVMHKVPDGFEFVSATKGGKFDRLSKTAAWFVGRIEPGQTSTMTLTLEASQLGEFEHQVSAITDQGARSEDRLSAKVDGIASLALEVKDVNDPVEIGVETAYEIVVKNQGTKHAQNVAVACELPAGVELVDVKSPARHNLQGRVVVFQPLPALDAKQSAVYRIIVKGKLDGYQRFRARLASDSIQEPLLVEELTKFYGE